MIASEPHHETQTTASSAVPPATAAAVPSPAPRGARVNRPARRSRAKVDPQKARAAITEAQVAAMEAEAFRRAVKGVLKPVFHQGKITARVRQYSDPLLALLLKANLPAKYRENGVTIANHVEGAPAPELLAALSAANETNQRLAAIFEARRRRQEAEA